MNSLPPEPRLLIEGNVAAAVPYVGIARKLAKRAYQSGIRVKTWRVSADVVVRVENYPESYLSKVFIRSAPASYPFLAVTWEPEGIVLTPRTEAVPYGYGFPKREVGVLEGEGLERHFTGGAKINPPFGTVISDKDHEFLNQVLLNKFPNNKYLDRSEFIVGLPNEEENLFQIPVENRRLRETLETEHEASHPASWIVYWPPFYFPPDAAGSVSFWAESSDGFKWYDGPGLNKQYNFTYKPIKREEGSPLYRQFEVEENGLSTVFSTKLIYEEESEEWFCHWPEELLYDNDGYEMLFYMTNQYRAEVGRPPMFREIRGHAETARMALAECQRAKVLFHDNVSLYRQGYKTVTQRCDNAGVLWKNLGENLLISSAVSGYSIEKGEEVARLWKDSPPHYANMIDAEWDDHSTSHNISGVAKGSATSAQYTGELDPAASGSFWCQLFTKREYWVMAGNVNQTTRYGSISYFWGASPLGLPYSIGSSKELYLYFKGRNIFIYPAANLASSGYLVFLIGAAICKIGDVYYIRVIFSAGVAGGSTSSLYVYRRPLFGNHIEDWVEEATRTNESTMNLYSTVSFDYDGNKAIINRVSIDAWNFANYYFPLASNQFRAISASQSFLEYSNGAFSFVANPQGPAVSYQVFTEDYVDGSTTYRYITRYLQTCTDEEGVSIHPYYVYNENRDGTELKYLRLKTTFTIDQQRINYVSPTYQNDWSIVETVIFHSGKELVTKNASASSNEAKSLMVLGDNKHVILFLYIDPVNEDLVYIKINFRGNGAAVYGQAFIYADLYDAEEPQLITSFAEVLLNSTSLSHPNLLSAWQISPNIGLPNSTTKCENIIHPAVAFERDISGNLYPFFQNTAEEWRCTGYTGPLRALATKPLQGTFTARLDYAFGQSTRCSFSPSLGLMNFNYNANIKICDYQIDGVTCFATRYKDRFIAQIKFDLDKTPKLWNIPYEDENIVWANFDLDLLVGMGSLSDVLPMGAIL